MKVGCLALGMLSCLKRGLVLLAEHKGIDLDLATIPAEDPRTCAMIRKADPLGTVQIESRAQMSMLPRLKPRTFYDLFIDVAIVLSSPIETAKCSAVRPGGIWTLASNSSAPGGTLQSVCHSAQRS